MPRARNAKIWNTDLIAACDARLTAAIQKQSRNEHSWRLAKAAIEASSKEIYITSTNKIMNLPSFNKTITDELSNVVRGVTAVDPGFAAGRPSPAAAAGPSPAGGAAPEHQLLRQMQRRGGSYAILCAFHFNCDPGQQLTKRWRRGWAVRGEKGRSYA